MGEGQSGDAQMAPEEHQVPLVRGSARPSVWAGPVLWERGLVLAGMEFIFAQCLGKELDLCRTQGS